MWNIQKFVSLLFFGLLVDTAMSETVQTSPDIEAADMLLWGGTIHTGENDRTPAEAIGVRSGVIVFVGSRVEAQHYLGQKTKVVSLGGSTLFPGFVDAHSHLSGIGLREMTLNLEGLTSLKALQKSLQSWTNQHPTEEIILGRGWIETHWPENRFPTRWDIDKIVGDKPVLLTRADGHALVANSAALIAAGISASTPVPFGGDILKDNHGEPTGMLIDAAMSLVRGLVPAVTADTVAAQLIKGGEVYASYGWTGTHNMSVPWAIIPTMEQLSDSGALKIKVYNSINASDAERIFETGVRHSKNNRITTRAIKMYMDGALGSRGAALLEPYSDAKTSGLLLMKANDTLPVLRKALKKGIQINTHAIGDRGNRLVLDWYEKTFAETPSAERKVADPRWRIEHAQIINPSDIERFKKLDVIASMQPSHAIGDLHFAPDRLNDKRLHGAYAWKTLIESGVTVAGGSDAPVERGDPRIEFYAAVARADMNGFQGPNWHPEEAISRQDALKMFTLWPAIASFQETDLGSIKVGKRADFTIFAKDLMTIPAAEILTTDVVMTIVDGEIAFEKP